MRYRIKNWREYQHYKGRCPPWIKFHSHTFTSKDWIMLADASRLAMLVCMVVASMDDAGDGSFDADPEYLRRVAYLDTPPDLAPLLDSGFLVIASECKQPQAKDTPSVSVSVSVSESVSEGGVGEKSTPEDFVGPIPESMHETMPDPLEDFDGDTPKHARHFWGLFCGQYHGRTPLRNIHSEASHREMRHFAKAIHTHGEKAIKTLTDYYADPPKGDKALNAYQIVCKLGLSASANIPPPWEASKKKEKDDGMKAMREAILGKGKI